MTYNHQNPIAGRKYNLAASDNTGTYSGLVYCEKVGNGQVKFVGRDKEGNPVKICGSTSSLKIIEEKASFSGAEIKRPERGSSEFGQLARIVKASKI